MKKKFKDVSIDENGIAYNQNGKLPMYKGGYYAERDHYTTEQLKEIYLKLDGKTPSIKIDQEQPVKQESESRVSDPKLKNESRVTIKQPIESRVESRVESREKQKVFDKLKKLYNARTGETNGKFKGYYLINGKRYSSTHEAAKDLNQSQSTIFRWCKAGKNGYSMKQPKNPPTKTPITPH